jgi:hypothetical protein
MDFGSDSDGDAFGGGKVVHSSRRHLYSTGRMSSFALSLRTIKLRPFNICYASTEVTRFFSSPKHDLIKALSSKQPPPPIQEESKRASLIIICP